MKQRACTHVFVVIFYLIVIADFGFNIEETTCSRTSVTMLR